MLYHQGKNKYLYASPVGETGKEYLKKIINAFGNCFDYLIFVYDNTQFNEKIFEQCTFVYEKGLKWYFMKKYLIPTYIKKYDYVFIWDDDIDVDSFSYLNFLEIMKKNKLEIAQPSLKNSITEVSHKITLKRRDYRVGRFTNYIELMVPVFSKKAWSRIWKIIESGWNYWGWGYDNIIQLYYNIKRMGIVDCESVIHTRPMNMSRYLETITFFEHEDLLQMYDTYITVKYKNFGPLSDVGGNLL